jgi:hypothetical protein
MIPYRFSSLTRIAPLTRVPFRLQPVDRDDWASGDYVACDIVDACGFRAIELPDGRMSEAAAGDVLVGALGRRHATLEATGTFEKADGALHLLTSAGLLGGATSCAAELPPLLALHYRGHVFLDGEKATMARFVEPVPPLPFETPTVLLVGTSMSAGKTTAGKMAVRHLTQAGLRVVGAKLTGAGRYRDILAFLDAGAVAVYDFVDAGLPSTVVPVAEYEPALAHLLTCLARAEADVAVVEIGASPMEPYNGAAAIEALTPHVVATLLAASDPYAVVGVMEAFGMEPDVVCGRTTSTQAGIELAQRLSGVRALDLSTASATRALGRLLLDRLDIDRLDPSRSGPESRAG